MKSFVEFYNERINTSLKEIILESKVEETTIWKETPYNGKNFNKVMTFGSIWCNTPELFIDLCLKQNNKLGKFLTSDKKVLEQFTELINSAYSNTSNKSFDTVPFVIKRKQRSKKTFTFGDIHVRRMFSKAKEYLDKFHEIPQFKSVKLGSGFGSNLGNEFEDYLTNVISAYILNTYNEQDIEYGEKDEDAFKVADELLNPEKGYLIKHYKGLKEKLVIDNTEWKLSDNGKIDPSCGIAKIVRQTGGSNTKRNKNGEIISKDFVIPTYDNDKKSEKSLENILIKSGEIISDITLLDKIYLSIKHERAQLSGIVMNPPFYPDDKSKRFNNQAFYNLCAFFGVEEEDVKQYYSIPKEKREKQKIIKATNKNNNLYTETLLSTLALTIIGANYWYVNSNLHFRYISPKIEDNNTIPISLNLFYDKGVTLNPTGLKIPAQLRNNSKKENVVDCEVIFRTSDGDKEYPYRLFIHVKDHEWIDILFPYDEKLELSLEPNK